ncbi:MAG: CoB--CoM heterodisulfide reductase iron-sulfur subunit B family protein [Coriobacteriales bacterium]|jgi:succinate dehydrogenase / fumarate reductase cytochrome b subunit
MAEKLRYAFFPGCTLESASAELKTSTVKTCAALGIEIEEIDGWSCCGASQVQDIDEYFGYLVNARNIALAEKAGYTSILTVCNTCTLVLRKTKKALDENPELKKKVNEDLAEIGLEYKGTCDITHYLWVLVRDYGLDELKKHVKRPLTDLHVANFYGCHILMPPDVMGFEDDRNPHSMEDLAEALGAQNVDYEQRLACCGFHSIYPAEREALTSDGVSCITARKAGADCIVTPCPLCHFSLDLYQADAQKCFDEDIRMPILHLPQLVGLALGFSPSELEIDHHAVNATSMLNRVLG